jgi:hypothetical protein
MAKEALETVLQHIRALTDRREGHASDADLLERFITHREEAAFAALMRRNGPMVLAVCKRVAGHVQDAEDAFQATFMLLARRADTIHRKESLPAWLHGVARRVAQKARRAMIRRQERERRTARPVNLPAARLAVVPTHVRHIDAFFLASMVAFDSCSMGSAGVAAPLRSADARVPAPLRPPNWLLYGDKSP